MKALDYLINKFSVDVSQPMPLRLPMSRDSDIPLMFKELGFTTGAEVGVYRGAYSEILLKAIPGLKLYGIDLWERYPGYKDYPKEDISLTINEAKERTKDYNCELIKDWSTEAVKRFEDNSLDFVYLDANHSYENCVQDIALWSKKVRSGGILYGHDFEDWSNTWRKYEMNVINAVTGWCTSYKISPWFVIARDKHPGWMYIKP